MIIIIKIHRLNGQEFYINDELIEFIEETPDTVISMTTGKKIVAAESVDDIISKIIEFRKRIFEADIKRD